MCSSDAISSSCSGNAITEGGPASHPCGSCPYRQDVASGVWDVSEYEKLPRYDAPTSEQPPAVFLCHQQNGRVCAGWAGCHDMDENLSLRFAPMMGTLTSDEAEATRTYASPVELWESGRKAHDHGVASITAPNEKAQQLIAKLERRKQRRM